MEDKQEIKEDTIAIEKLMTEKGISRETAFSIIQDRKEQQFVKQSWDAKEKKLIPEMMENLQKTSTLENVHNTFKKHYFIPNTNHIDVLLATKLTMKMKGDPVWLIFYGASGDLKSGMVKAFSQCDDVKLIDNLTPNTFATGMKDVDDLGKEINGKDVLLLIPDMATVTSKNQDEKNEIWGQLRTVYDGYINKRTGSGINKAYNDVHATLIGCSTPIICEEILVHAQLGTRDFMYSTGADAQDIDSKMDSAWDNTGKEDEINAEIKKIVHDFYLFHTMKEHPIPDEMKKFMKEQAKRLMILRAGGAVDRSTRELLSPVVPEVPTRLFKQFKKLYYGLKSLDENYPDEKCKEIIINIVNSSGNKVRQLVLEHLELSEKLNEKKWYKIAEVQLGTRLSRSVVKQQLETLWNMNIIEKNVKEERIGGYVFTDSYGTESVRGGYIENVDYYRKKQE